MRVSISLLIVLTLLGPGRVLGAEPRQFRVCADPVNMPASNQQLEGFENKIATLVAKELGETVRYTWWGQRRGFIRNTMNATLKEQQCDVVIGVPKGYDLVLTTKPYYRSTYVSSIPEQGIQPHVARRSDPEEAQDRRPPARQRLRESPPVYEPSKRGIVATSSASIRSIPSNPRARSSTPSRAQDRRGDRLGSDAQLLRQHQHVPLAVVPILSKKGDLPFEFEISMGVRPGDQKMKAEMEGVLDRKRADILKILNEFGVPLVGGKVETK